MLMAACQRGDRDEAFSILEKVDSARQVSGKFRFGFGINLMVSALLDVELDIEESPLKAWGSDDDPEAEETGRMVFRRYAALKLIREGDEEAAAEYYDSLLPTAGWFTLQGGFSGDRLLGVISWKSGKISRAEKHFNDALGFCRDGGYRVELSWVLSDFAEMVIERDEPGDREKAVGLQDEAIAIAQELGLKPLLERVLAQREILKA